MDRGIAGQVEPSDRLSHATRCPGLAHEGRDDERDRIVGHVAALHVFERARDGTDGAGRRPTEREGRGVPALPTVYWDLIRVVATFAREAGTSRCALSNSRACSSPYEALGAIMSSQMG